MNGAFLHGKGVPIQPLWTQSIGCFKAFEDKSKQKSPSHCQLEAIGELMKKSKIISREQTNH